MRLPALLFLALLAFMPVAWGQEAPRIGVRVGTHPDRGRLVFDWPSRVGYSLEEQDGRVVIRFAAPARIDLAAVRRPPRNVLAIDQDGEAIALRIPPGARPLAFRLGNRIVVDVRDPVAAAEPAPPARAPTPPPTRTRLAAAAPPPAAEPIAAALPQAAAPLAQTAVAPGQAVAPAAHGATPAAHVPVTAAASASPAATRSLATRATALPGARPSSIRLLPGAPAIALDAGAEAGLAVFRRGDWVHVVLDRAIDTDLSALRGHPVFGGLEAQPAGEATALRLPLSAPAHLAVRRDGAAWVLEVTPEASRVDSANLRAIADAGPPTRLLLQGGLPGGSVTLADPATGETLLVGTLRQPGPGVHQARRLPEFDLLPSMQGAAIVARSDRLALRVTTENRFSLQATGTEPLGLGPQLGREPPAAATAMTRLLDLPSGSVQTLLERLRNVLTAVNAAPPLARAPVRRDAAETLLALGMPQEGQAMGTIAFRESPEAREDPRLLLAHGVAALLSGRLEDAGSIDDPRLPSRDEVVVWRALLAIARGQDAAAALRASAPVLLTYPEALRARTLPMAAEAMASGGEATAAAALLAQAGDAPGLDLARAMVVEARGERDAAIAAYGALVAGRDRHDRAIAMRRLAELRLTAGIIDKPGAAEALEQSLYAWRGGAEEPALRRRIAELRQEAGQGEQAFALIDETGKLFPDQAAALRPALQDAFASALETAPPLAAATLFDTRPDLLPAGARGQAAVLVLADRLAGLDLPQRAAALLQGAMGATTDSTARAAIGARLAAVRAAEGDSAGTIAALDASESINPEASLAMRRTVLRARAMARSGARPEAEALLATLGHAGAAPLADLRAEARDWAGAAAAMADHLAAMLPVASEPLGQGDRAALARQAAYLALAGDDAGLSALRAAQGTRMANGPLAEAFGVLTSDPVRGLSDLPRLQRELGMMRLLPSRLDALRAGVQVAR
ncbi:hypothetical protein [Neoroseomonas lacus]|uniref:Uncharacterized protein n=1 Tax=Neoroseomonas lacus TaxID=287609 RepID=A0A917NH65_9PROT|nr:hypothetical protein [Neoroseomonas lacus]GGJ00748.1 hypothetical protein GCM10011320_04450 [Neoroseomonas lacus]